jgi:hypothetical protein
MGGVWAQVALSMQSVGLEVPIACWVCALGGVSFFVTFALLGPWLLGYWQPTNGGHVLLFKSLVKCFVRRQLRAQRGLLAIDNESDFVDFRIPKRQSICVHYCFYLLHAG